jgi:hypothetical protein
MRCLGESFKKLHPYTKKEIATIEDFTSLAKGLKVD